MFVRTQLRTRGADVSAANPGVRAIFEKGEDYHEGSTWAELDPGLGRKPAAVVVTKHRTSAFAGTGLDLVLRANEVDSIIVAGVATSAMVAATVYSAAGRDYAVRVTRDVCADPDLSVHETFLTSIFPSRGVGVASNAELQG